MARVEPKPCPCCGGKAGWIIGDKDAGRVDRVQCLTCWLEITGTYTEGSALFPWNKRVEPIKAPASPRFEVEDRVVFDGSKLGVVVPPPPGKENTMKRVWVLVLNRGYVECKNVEDLTHLPKL